MTRFAKRSLGQNFLHDRSVIDRIITEVAPHPGETIVEIGPGRGALTELLVRSGALVIAIELDDGLAAALYDRLPHGLNFTLVTGDALEVTLAALIAPAETTRVVANLPYNISTPILQKLIEQRGAINEMTLMLQREVVDRIAAGPGDPERGFLSVFVEAYCATEKLFDVAPSAFKPIPKVWSSVVRLTVRQGIPKDLDEELLWRLVSAGFQQRRKTILNNLRSASGLFPDSDPAESAARLLTGAGIAPNRRAQSLTLDEWVRLGGIINAK